MVLFVWALEADDSEIGDGLGKVSRFGFPLVVCAMLLIVLISGNKHKSSFPLWHFIVYVQFIRWIPLIDVNQPGFYRSFFGELSKSFDEFEVMDKDNDAFRDHFEEYGLKSHAFLDNAEESVVAWFIGLFFYMVLTTFSKRFSEVARFSMLIRLSLIVYMDIVLCSMIQMTSITFSDTFYMVSSLVGLLSLFIGILVLFILPISYKRAFDKLELTGNTKHIQQITTLLEEFSEERTVRRHFYSIFLFTRFVASVAYVVFIDTPIIQLVILALCQVLLFTYVLIVKPFIANGANLMTMLSEGCTFIFIILTGCFYIDDLSEEAIASLCYLCVVFVWAGEVFCLIRFILVFATGRFEFNILKKSDSSIFEAPNVKNLNEPISIIDDTIDNSKIAKDQIRQLEIETRTVGGFRNENQPEKVLWKTSNFRIPRQNDDMVVEPVNEIPKGRYSKVAPMVAKMSPKPDINPEIKQRKSVGSNPKNEMPSSRRGSKYGNVNFDIKNLLDDKPKLSPRERMSSMDKANPYANSSPKEKSSPSSIDKPSARQSIDSQDKPSPSERLSSIDRPYYKNYLNPLDKPQISKRNSDISEDKNNLSARNSIDESRRESPDQLFEQKHNNLYSSDRFDENPFIHKQDDPDKNQPKRATNEIDTIVDSPIDSEVYKPVNPFEVKRNEHTKDQRLAPEEDFERYVKKPVLEDVQESMNDPSNEIKTEINTIKDAEFSEDLHREIKALRFSNPKQHGKNNPEEPSIKFESINENKADSEHTKLENQEHSQENPEDQEKNEEFTESPHIDESLEKEEKIDAQNSEISDQYEPSIPSKFRLKLQENEKELEKDIPNIDDVHTNEIKPIENKEESPITNQESLGNDEKFSPSKFRLKLQENEKELEKDIPNIDDIHTNEIKPIENKEESPITNQESLGNDEKFSPSNFRLKLMNSEENEILSHLEEKLPPLTIPAIKEENSSEILKSESGNNLDPNEEEGTFIPSNFRQKLLERDTESFEPKITENPSKIESEKPSIVKSEKPSEAKSEKPGKLEKKPQIFIKDSKNPEIKDNPETNDKIEEIQGEIPNSFRLKLIENEEKDLKFNENDKIPEKEKSESIITEKEIPKKVSKKDKKLAKQNKDPVEDTNEIQTNLPNNFRLKLIDSQEENIKSDKEFKYSEPEKDHSILTKKETGKSAPQDDPKSSTQKIHKQEETKESRKYVPNSFRLKLVEEQEENTKHNQNYKAEEQKNKSAKATKEDSKSPSKKDTKSTKQEKKNNQSKIKQEEEAQAVSPSNFRLKLIETEDPVLPQIPEKTETKKKEAKKPKEKPKKNKKDLENTQTAQSVPQNNFRMKLLEEEDNSPLKFQEEPKPIEKQPPKEESRKKSPKRQTDKKSKIESQNEPVQINDFRAKMLEEDIPPPPLHKSPTSKKESPKQKPKESPKKQTPKKPEETTPVSDFRQRLQENTEVESAQKPIIIESKVIEKNKASENRGRQREIQDNRLNYSGGSPDLKTNEPKAKSIPPPSNYKPLVKKEAQINNILSSLPRKIERDETSRRDPQVAGASIVFSTNKPPQPTVQSKPEPKKESIFAKLAKKF